MEPMTRAAILCACTLLTGAQASELSKAEASGHWAFQAVKRSSIPRAPDGTSAIDAFISAKLREQGLSQNPPATRRELIRRAYFDLLGLPPNPEDVFAF